MTGDRVGRAVRVELADPCAKVDQHAQGEEPGNRVDNARGTEVVVAKACHQPAVRMPAPCRAQYPDEAAQAFRMLREAFTIRGMGIASFDPKVDAQRKTLQAVLGIIGEVVG